SVEDVVRDLKTRGVEFEHYDMPETKRQGDVHVSGSMKNAWFKDPDGNILGIMSGVDVGRRSRSEPAAGAHCAGRDTGAPFIFTNSTRNLAGLVVLAFRLIT